MCLAVPGRITRVTGSGASDRSADVAFGGITKQVSLAFVPEAQVGDHVLVHVGVAITRVDEAEAVRVFQYLDEIDALSQELGEPGGGEP